MRNYSSRWTQVKFSVNLRFFAISEISSSDDCYPILTIQSNLYKMDMVRWVRWTIFFAPAKLKSNSYKKNCLRRTLWDGHLFKMDRFLSTVSVFYLCKISSYLCDAIIIFMRCNAFLSHSVATSVSAKVISVGISNPTPIPLFVLVPVTLQLDG